MTVLIVESNPELVNLWRSHIERYNHSVVAASTQTEAVRMLQTNKVCVLILNVMLHDGSAFAVADYASYRFPGIRILFVTAQSFFSDGSIFNHVANARAYISASTSPSDLAAMADHYAMEECPRP